mmetsp:Transcript_21019/g.85759  ORF Transcript_21019/g.85759 Transcript_21019/m.85759 type:complete len:124 (-) Transcript_21019:89-460(-)
MKGKLVVNGVRTAVGLTLTRRNSGDFLFVVESGSNVIKILARKKKGFFEDGALTMGPSAHLKRRTSSGSTFAQVTPVFRNNAGLGGVCGSGLRCHLHRHLIFALFHLEINLIDKQPDIHTLSF